MSTQNHLKKSEEKKNISLELAAYDDNQTWIFILMFPPELNVVLVLFHDVLTLQLALANVGAEHLLNLD